MIWGGGTFEISAYAKKGLSFWRVGGHRTHFWGSRGHMPRGPPRSAPAHLIQRIYKFVMIWLRSLNIQCNIYRYRGRSRFYIDDKNGKRSFFPPLFSSYNSYVPEIQSFLLYNHIYTIIFPHVSCWLVSRFISALKVTCSHGWINPPPGVSPVSVQRATVFPRNGGLFRNVNSVKLFIPQSIKTSMWRVYVWKICMTFAIW